VAAIPTTLSGAEMSGIHRFPAGAEKRAKGPVKRTTAARKAPVKKKAPAKK
jgi:DNA topoisomerase-1